MIKKIHNKDNDASVLIITRTKNRPLLLERAINSIGNQSYDNYTMVIVNDGGDPKRVNELTAKYNKILGNRIKVIHNDQSMGITPALNLGIKSQDSKYVVTHDDDDSWDKDFLKKTTEHLEKTGAMGVIVPTDIIYEKVEGHKITKLSQIRLFPGTKYISLYDMCIENYATTISFLFRRRVFDDIGYYDETLNDPADWDFALRFLLKYDIDYLDNNIALAFYHQRQNAVGGDGNNVFKDSTKILVESLINKYLRNDIETGKLGLGYIMNSARKAHFTNQNLIDTIKHISDNQLIEILDFTKRQQANQQKMLEDIMARQIGGRAYFKLRSLPNKLSAGNNKDNDHS